VSARTIFLKGRLGNQLFQLAYALNLAENGSEVVLVNSHVDRSAFYKHEELKVANFIAELMDEWPGKEKVRVIVKSGWKAKFFNLRIHGNLRHKLTYSKPGDQSNVEHPSEEHFQDFRKIESSFPPLADQIDRFMSKRIELKNSVLDETVLFHIRRGDYLEPRHRNKFGVLKMEYFLKIRDRYSLRNPVIVTDDENLLANENVEELDPKIIVGPSELDQFEVLKLMSSAKLVVASNSSFSWWGAALSMHKGGSAILPRPWFKADSENDKVEHIYLPNCSIAEAIFEN